MIFVNINSKIMKKLALLFTIALATMLTSCGNTEETSTNTEVATSEAGPGQSAVVDETSSPNIVQVAVGSKDHTTLVTAVKAAELVDALSNAGPFTVFAPTNAAFEKLPPGTVEGLLAPEKKEDLANILGYHTYVGSLKTEYMNDGQEFDMVFGGKVKIAKKDGKTFVNGSEIVASIPTSNGIIHVIGDVLLPK
jgi:uncharacterized surface protein with fasciclin (FAS1) repeats